ncbi:MAG: RNA-binding protein [Firmicutes bacterium]|jgi:large subunit ribosomal protein L14e|nr:RNA-binding protein [Bacillota bacterium]
MEPKLGQVVISVAGRDRGRSYIIIEILDDNTVAVADGVYRQVSKPKRKNLRHLMMTRTVDNFLSEKLLLGVDITNEEVCEALEIRNKAELERTDCSHG